MSSIENEVREKLNNLAEVEFCYPLDIFSISNQIEEELYPDSAVDLIIRDYGKHENAFVRRAILTTLRFIGSDFASKHIELIRRGLKDDNGWVVYDSAWILFNMDSISTEDLTQLKIIASKFSSFSPEELDSFKPKESEEYASKQAAEAIQKHTKT